MSIHPTRTKFLYEADAREGDYVLYWMQQSQRAVYNHALEFAIQQANKLDRMLLLVFGLMDDYPEANLRHYTFMLEGLKETRAALGMKIKEVE
jgi:deoxyribodipyrimidine photo-lyase